MLDSDTIVAISTGPGAGGIGILRLSGPQAQSVATALCGIELQPRRARRVKFLDEGGRIIDDGIALAFPGPQSYTGEDVVELHAHGSPYLLRSLLQRCFALGARQARPGEFTERAFRNHKLDLSQAEAIADLIAAGSEAAARAARRSLEGIFSGRVEELLEALSGLRVHVEAAIDFPEEEIDFLGDEAVRHRLDAVLAIHAGLLKESERGQRLRDGLHVVIIGPPNVGKSCLLNALAGSERAIVTAQPGTTRDLLREHVLVDGIELTLVDTAGLRETSDPVEREGMRRARTELERADLVLAVVDATDAESGHAVLSPELSGDGAVIWLHNKSDLVAVALQQRSPDTIWVSARTGQGMDELRDRLRCAAGTGDEGTRGAFSARARHVEALRRVGAHLQAAVQRLGLERAGELAAEELRLAQGVLNDVTGVTTNDDLLGSIFSSFCIGK